MSDIVDSLRWFRVRLRRNWKIQTGVAIVILIIVAIISTVITSKFDLADIGFIFTFVVGVATIVALIVAISQIMTLSPKIMSLQESLIEIREVILKATKIGESETRNEEFFKRHYLRVVCHSPAHGNISVRGSLEYDKYQLALKTAASCINVETICLGLTKELKEFYDAYTLQGIEKEKIVEKAYMEAVHLIKDIHLPDEKSKSKVFSAKFSHLPTYHFFLTNSKAVVLIPFHLPFMLQTDRNQGEAGRKQVKKGKEKVEWLGIVITERGLLDRLERTFDELKNISEQIPKDEEHIQKEQIE